MLINDAGDVGMDERRTEEAEWPCVDVIKEEA